MLACNICRANPAARNPGSTDREGLTIYEHIVACFAQQEGFIALHMVFDSNVAMGCVRIWPAVNSTDYDAFTLIQRLDKSWDVNMLHTKLYAGIRLSSLCFYIIKQLK